MLFFACCWLCSSLPAVGYALLCLLLAMLFFACCWLCSSLPAVGFALLFFCTCSSLLYLWAVLQIAMSPLCSSCATGYSLLPARVIRACFLLTRIRSSGYRRPRSSFAIVLCWSSSLAHRKRARQSDIASFYFSTTGSSGCGSFTVLLTSPSASGVFLGCHFMVVYYSVIVGLVPPTPLLGAAPLRDQRHYSVLRHFVIIGSR